MTLTLVAPVAPSRVMWEPVNQDSPLDCPRCGSPMERITGPLDEPDEDGLPVVVTRDECLSCGREYPVAEEKPLTRDEVRRRVRLVREHRKVTDHTHCGPHEPCRVKRPGLPAPGPIEPTPQEEQ